MPRTGAINSLESHARSASKNIVLHCNSCNSFCRGCIGHKLLQTNMFQNFFVYGKLLLENLELKLLATFAIILKWIHNFKKIEKNTLISLNKYANIKTIF